MDPSACLFPVSSPLARLTHNKTQGLPAAAIIAAMSIDLARGANWRYRTVVGGEARPWCDDVREAIEGLVPRREPAPWAGEWIVFGPGEFEQVDLTGRTEVPRELIVVGAELARHVVRADRIGRIDLGELFGAIGEKRTAWLFGWIELPDDMAMTIHAGCDYRMQLFIDGELQFDNFGTGNMTMNNERCYEIDVELSAGWHLVAVAVCSGSAGWAFASEATRLQGPPDEPTGAFVIESSRTFEVDDPERFAALTLECDSQKLPTLNGRAIELPIPSLKYDRVPGLSPGLLKRGENVLLYRWDEDESLRGAPGVGVRCFGRSDDRPRLVAECELIGMEPADAQIESGPILNCIGTDRAAITCTTNMPTEVTLTIDGREQTSSRNLIHRFAVDGLEAGGAYDYTLRTAGDEKGGRVRTIAADGSFTFGFASDPSPRPDWWAKVAAVLADAELDLFVHGGDMIGSGRHYNAWHIDFFNRSPELFAHTPIYPILGNHDEGSGLFNRIFVTPTDDRHWYQRIGPALLVGIDGADDWSEDSANVRWLDDLLGRSESPFVFVFNHYPAWTSANHGRTDEHGQLIESQVHAARYVILPICQRHSVTAMFNGHDHVFERSELPDGLTLVTSGGGGGRLYRQRESGPGNPYSTVFASVHHYLRVRVEADHAEMRAIDLDGNELDRREWAPRAVAQA